MRNAAPKCIHSLGIALLGGLILALVACESSPREASRQVVIEMPGDPQAAQTWFEQGVQAVHAQDLEEAEGCFLNAIEADESHGPAHNNLGKIYFQENRLQDAALSFQNAIDNMPFRAEPASNLGLVLEIGNRLDEAIKQYEAALALEVGDPEYLANLVRARVKRGDNDAALRQQLRTVADGDTREVWADWARGQLDRIETAERIPPRRGPGGR